MSTLKNDAYHGFTYRPQWKADCKNGVHLWDEVLSDDSHYLTCDACGLVINFRSKDVDRTHEEPEYTLNKKLEEL